MAHHTDLPPSGEQFHLTAGSHAATVVEVGGGIREYAVAGRDVLESYPLDAMCDGAHGAPLIPWPNRLEDGAYTFDGTDQQVALTEPDKRNAIHGLLRWRNWRALRHEAERVVMGVRLHPSKGYPFVLDVRIEYSLDADTGLTVRTTATNLGETACPYGHGQHPYLSAGSGPVDECSLTLPAATWIDTENPRQLPTTTHATAGTDKDFNRPQRLGEQRLDVPFTDLVRDDQQRAWAHLTAADGSRASLWVDETYEFIEIYTGDTLAPDRRRRGLGAEPMTCPPNAFRTGDRLHRLEPGTSLTATWGALLS